MLKGYYRKLLPSLMVIFFLFLFVSSALSVTYTSIANGNWTATSTWTGGTVPPITGGIVPSADTINIRHEVDYNAAHSTFKNNGTVLVQPVTGTTAILKFPTGVSVENLATGIFKVINGQFIQCRFLNCDDGVPASTEGSGNWKNIGGMVEIRNANVEVAQDWVNESGGTRIVVDKHLRKSNPVF